jgi:hypothetical protein
LFDQPLPVRNDPDQLLAVERFNIPHARPFELRYTDRP